MTQRDDAIENLGEESEQLQAMAFETHVIAWPPREPGDPVLTDVFEGLD